MQPIRGRALRLLFHLGLLAVLMAVAVVVIQRESPRGSYETTVSAFRVHSHRVRPPLAQPHVQQVVERTFSGIPQRGSTLGRARAPVTLQFFADPECPEARQFAVQLLPVLVQRWVRDGRLRIEYRGERAETIWPDVFRRQQLAVLAAGEQGKLWQYLEFFYHYQGPEFTRYADDWFLRSIAKEVSGLDLRRWAADREGQGLAGGVAADLRSARERHVIYTPAFLIGPTGGKLERLLHFTLTEPLAFEGAFEAALG
ncbi:MAG TPA: thioredoxin domain-containing protein [Solirubrobacterales bacterium]|jgi:protein-disulfide isomerase